MRKRLWGKGTQKCDNKSASNKINYLKFPARMPREQHTRAAALAMQRASFLFSKSSANSVPVRKLYHCSHSGLARAAAVDTGNRKAEQCCRKLGDP